MKKNNVTIWSESPILWRGRGEAARRFSTTVLLACFCMAMVAKAPKYVFYFIGDGMGLNQVVATQYYLRSCDGELGVTPLCFTQFPYTGIATSYSGSSDVTDSAAGGTALATGYKTYNGAIGVANDGAAVTSIAEKAHRYGAKVGVATSVTINHATPASFYAHQKSRNDYYEIGAQLPTSGFEFFAGGDFAEKTNPDKPSAPHLYDLAREAGYAIVRGYDEYASLDGEADKVVLIQKEDMVENTLPYAIDAREGDLTLTQITTAAIDHLYDRRHKEGFFLMVEGGKIDYACHANDAAAALVEVVDFDNAIRVAYDFYKQHPKETLIIITADHETGGFTLGNGSYALNFGALQAQKVSQAGFSRIVNRMRHESKDNVTWEQMQEALKANFGFWDTITLSERDENALRAEYERSFKGDKNVKMAESLYYRDEPISALAVRILNRIAMVSWPVGSHTAAYVPVFAVGNGAERFCGQMDNIDIPKRIAEVAGYGAIDK